MGHSHYCFVIGAKVIYDNSIWEVVERRAAAPFSGSFEYLLRCKRRDSLIGWIAGNKLRLASSASVGAITTDKAVALLEAKGYTVTPPKSGVVYIVESITSGQILYFSEPRTDDGAYYRLIAEVPWTAGDGLK